MYMKTLTKQSVNLMLLVVSVVIFYPAVYAQRNVKGNKNVTSVEHKVADFTSIEVGSAFNVFIEKADAPLVRVETDENLHEQISLRVENDKLLIGSKGISNPTKLDVYVFYTELISADVSGAASLKSKQPVISENFTLNVSGAAKVSSEFDVDQLVTIISGASGVTLEGHADVHLTEVSGAANLNAVGLITTRTKAKVSGAARAKVTATEKIDSDVSGAGKLEYFDGTSLVNIGREGQFSIHIDKDINIDSLDYVDVLSSNNSDSVRIRIGNLEIEVYDGENTRVKVGPGQLEVDESGKVKLIKEKKKEKFNGHWAGIDMGINGYLTPSGELDVPEEYSFLDLRYEKSINLQINVFEQNFALISNKIGLVTGIGLEWNNYRFGNNVKLDGSGDAIDKIILEDKISTKSKLNVKYLNVPLMLEYQTNSKNNINSFHISAGVVGGLRIGSHTKNVYENGSRRKDKERDDFHLNPLKVDATLRIGWGKLNMYGNYSLLTLFRENRGPELYPFSLGITLLSF